MNVLDVVCAGAGPGRVGAGADRGDRRGPLPRRSLAHARRHQAAGAGPAAGPRRRRDPAARHGAVGMVVIASLVP